jgi:hypothetical protein
MSSVNKDLIRSSPGTQWELAMAHNVTVEHLHACISAVLHTGYKCACKLPFRGLKQRTTNAIARTQLQFTSLTLLPNIRAA